MSSIIPPVLILGAGVNGICVARELVLNHIPVCIVDTRDIAFGATAKSSRLIHGGLRYLEYGDFSLVAESLHERDRLLKLAPHYVEPLPMFIPIRRRFGGLLAAGLRFLGLSRTRLGRWISASGERGLFTVRCGLWLYDLLARSRLVPRHRIHRTGVDGPPFPSDKYRWSCSYFDAQMQRPERFCIAMLRDLEATARESGTEFQILTYHRAQWDSGDIEISPVEETGAQKPPRRFQPLCVINATGAWGDLTLQDLSITGPQLFSGTKGTHLFTAQSKLVQALAGRAVYAEAADGRLVFLIPIDQGVMIGTTDDRFTDRPESARATASEIDYLLQLTNEIFPQVELLKTDIYATCSGIRPLPISHSTKTASISRGHHIDERLVGKTLVLTLIGGKLTTCRAFGEEVANRVLNQLGKARTNSTRERIIPGGEDHPADSAQLEQWLTARAKDTGYPIESCRAMWRLMGTCSCGTSLHLNNNTSTQTQNQSFITGTALPREFVQNIIFTEWVATLDDLVERRLLLALEPNLTRETLVSLAHLLIEAKPTEQTAEEMVARVQQRLKEYYGRTDI